MGAMDFLEKFKDKVLDAASYELLMRNYELQEENNRQLKEKSERLESENTALQEHVKKLSEENLQLREKLSNLALNEQFVIHEGLAFKRGKDDKFEPTVFCPNCKLVMSDSGMGAYKCPKCGLVKRCYTKLDAICSQLNAK